MQNALPGCCYVVANQHANNILKNVHVEKMSVALMCGTRH